MPTPALTVDEPEFSCALSGQPAADDAIEYDVEEDDPLEALPVGWTEIRISTRFLNPKAALIDATKAALVDQQLAQIPETNREAGRAMVETLIDANFAALEGRTQRFLVEERIAHCSPEQLATLCEYLGVETPTAPVGE